MPTIPTYPPARPQPDGQPRDRAALFHGSADTPIAGLYCAPYGQGQVAASVLGRLGTTSHLFPHPKGGLFLTKNGTAILSAGGGRPLTLSDGAQAWLWKRSQKNQSEVDTLVLGWPEDDGLRILPDLVQCAPNQAHHNGPLYTAPLDAWRTYLDSAQSHTTFCPHTAARTGAMLPAWALSYIGPVAEDPRWEGLKRFCHALVLGILLDHPPFMEDEWSIEVYGGLREGHYTWTSSIRHWDRTFDSENTQDIAPTIEQALSRALAAPACPLRPVQKMALIRGLKDQTVFQGKASGMTGHTALRAKALWRSFQRDPNAAVAAHLPG